MGLIKNVVNKVKQTVSKPAPTPPKSSSPPKGIPGINMSPGPSKIPLKPGTPVIQSGVNVKLPKSGRGSGGSSGGSGSSPTGGQSTQQGEVLVTPEGEVVGSTSAQQTQQTKRLPGQQLAKSQAPIGMAQGASQTTGESFGVVSAGARLSYSQQLQAIRNSNNPFSATLGLFNSYISRGVDKFQSALPSEQIRVASKRQGEIFATLGNQEFYGDKPYSELLPFERRGTAQVTNITPLTDAELLSLSYGAGEKEYIKRATSEAEANINELTNKFAKELEPRYNAQAESIGKSLQEQVNEGTKSAEQAKIEYERSLKTLEQKYSKEVADKVKPFAQNEYEIINENIRRSQSKRAPVEALGLFPVQVAEGLAFGGVASTGRAGALLVGSFGTYSAIKSAPEVIRAAEEKDVGMLTSFGLSTIAYAGGGAVGAKVGGALFNKPLVEEAIARSTVKNKIVADNYDAVVSRYRFDELGQRELKTLVDQGYSIRVVESKLVPKSQADAKLVPDVRGSYIEVIARDGTVVDVVRVGQFIAESKGKRFSRDILSQSIGKIEDSSGKFVTKTIEGNLKGKELKALREVETLESVEIEGIESPNPITRIISGTSESKLIRETNLKGGERISPLLKKDIYYNPNDVLGNILSSDRMSVDSVSSFLRLKEKLPSKPQSITNFIVKDRLKSLRSEEVPIGLEGEGINAIYGGYGVAVRNTISGGASRTKFVSEVKKVARPSRPFSISDKPGKGSLILKQVQDSVSKLFTGNTDTIVKGLASESSLKTQTSTPTFLGSQTSSGSYAGLGTYERTESSGGKFGYGFITTDSIDRTGTNLGGYNLLGFGTDIVEENSYIQRNKSSGVVIDNLNSGIIQIPEDNLSDALVPGLREGQTQQQRQQSQQEQKVNQRSITGQQFFFSPIPPSGPPLVFGAEYKEKKKKKRERGYIPEVKIEGTFVPVSSAPVSKARALLIGSGAADTSLARSFRITPTKKSVKSESFSVDLSKFRTFQQRKGIRTPLTNTFIEKSKYALERPEQRIIRPLAFAGQKRKARASLGIF